MFSLQGHTTWVKYGLYDPTQSPSSKKGFYTEFVETPIEKAITTLSGPQYKFERKTPVYFELVDLREVTIDTSSYRKTEGPCSGEEAVKRINKVVTNHLKSGQQT